MKTIEHNFNITIDRYSYQDLESEFNIKSTARSDRIKAAVEIGAMQPVHYLGKTPYLDALQMKELRFQNQHLLDGGTLKSYRESRQKSRSGGALSAERTAKDTDTRLLENTNGRSISNLKDNPWYDSLRNIKDEMLMNPIIQKQLRLEAYLQLNQPISDKDCIEIMGFKPPRTGFRDYCYQFEFWAWDYYRDPKQLDSQKPTGKQKLWKIRKIDIEAERQAKLVAKAKREADKEQAEAEDAIAVYDQMKEMVNAD